MTVLFLYSLSRGVSRDLIRIKVKDRASPDVKEAAPVKDTLTACVKEPV